MSNRTREKQALVVFVLMVCIGMGGLIWYLFAGHSWNVTASNIDDSVGQMEGYTAIVFDGTMPEVSEKTSKSKTPAATASEPSANDSEKSASVEDAATQEETEDKSSNTSGGVSTEAESLRSNSGLNGSSDTPNASNLASTDSTSGSSTTTLGTSSKTPLKASQVCESYQDKGASVLTLDMSDPSIYSEGTIVKRAGKRIGVISIEKALNEVSAKRLLAPFVSAKVDIMVCVAPDSSYVKDIEGFDIVVCNADTEISTTGQTEGKTFIVNAPTIGSVGAVLISPSNVVSAKVLDKL